LTLLKVLRHLENSKIVYITIKGVSKYTGLLNLHDDITNVRGFAYWAEGSTGIEDPELDSEECEALADPAKKLIKLL
jgi:hypothetical protein